MTRTMNDSPALSNQSATVVGALIAIAGALIPGTAGASETPRTSGEPAQVAAGTAPIATRRVYVTARLVNESGTPLAGAILVSSAGGQVVTDDDGLAELEIAVDRSADSVHVTGFASERGRCLQGNTTVGLTKSVDNRIAAGTIMLSSRIECEPEWIPTFGTYTATTCIVHTATVFDDGSGGGPALIVGGEFILASGVPAKRIAKWDGESWTALGSGMNGVVLAVATFDDGTGPALYAGGEFTSAGGAPANYIAKWDGSAWSSLGSGMNEPVAALTVFDDASGGGRALYAGGEFTSAGGVAASHIAKWNGTAWSTLGIGTDHPVRALTVYDDGLGGGPALYAGGEFSYAGGVWARRIAKWNGAVWSALGLGMNNTVQAIAGFDDGSGAGPALYAGGVFTSADGITVNRIAKWNGTAWSSLGSGLSAATNWVRALTVYDDGSGSGPALYMGGSFTSVSGVAAFGMARWNGTAWTPLASVLTGKFHALVVFDDGAGGGPALYAGGEFFVQGGIRVNSIGKWDGTAWSALQSGVTVLSGLNASVSDLMSFDDGSGGGPAIYMGGSFTMAGGHIANFIAKWDDGVWTPLGSGVFPNYVRTVIDFDDGSGSGPAVYAGGGFTAAGGSPAKYIAKWDGKVWAPLRSGMDFWVSALTVFDDGSGGGPALYAGGQFQWAGSVPANYVAKWDGTAWTPLGDGMHEENVSAFAVYDDGKGGGPALYAGGSFNSAEGVAGTQGIAKWDGSAWTSVGGGVGPGDVAVRSMLVYDDGLGGGPALYVSGTFTLAGGVPANRVAKWDGDVWSPLGVGLSNSASNLTVFDDGSGGGPQIYVTGSFQGGALTYRIAKWDGAVWTPFGQEFDGGIDDMLVFDDGSGAPPALYLGGGFIMSPAGDSFLAKLQGCPTCVASPHGDLSGDGCVNGTDLAIALGQWDPVGGSGHGYGTGDANCDGVVDGTDLAVVLGHWQPVCP